MSFSSTDTMTPISCSLFLVSFGLALAGALSGELHVRHISTGCKAFPGTDRWPSQESWAAFNESLGGKLLQPAPPGAVCDPRQPAYDANNCASLAAKWSTQDFHQSDPLSVMYNQYVNDTCLPDPRAPCSAAGYPAYVVNATTTRAVKLSLDYGEYVTVSQSARNRAFGTPR
jgi:hypothetical protein